MNPGGRMESLLNIFEEACQIFAVNHFKFKCYTPAVSGRQFHWTILWTKILYVTSADAFKV